MEKKRVSHTSFYLSCAVLACVLIIGTWSVFFLISYEKKRDLNNWRLTLGMMADDRANSVQGWAAGRFNLLRELASNGSLQLYVQQITQRPEVNRGAEPAQISYLRNLLIATAQRGGFDDQASKSQPVQANIALQADNGITLFSKNSEIITSTPGITKPDAVLEKALQDVVSKGRQAFFNMHLNGNNQPIVGFLVPVYALQKQSDQQEPIAVVYGFQNAADSLFGLLANIGRSTQTAETVLISRRDNLVQYLSPLSDGTAPLKRTLAANTEELAAAYALKYPGQFSRGNDYSGTECLFTSRAIDELNWTLVQKISTGEALAESNAHQRFLLITLLLALLLSGTLIVAAWWHGSSVREKEAVRELVVKSGQLEAQTLLLNAVNDNMTDYVMLLDHNNRLVFANRAMADALSTPADDLKGKSLQSILGPDNANQLQALLNAVAASPHPVSREVTLLMGTEHFIFMAACLQITCFINGHPAVLITLNDVTDLKEAQRRKERLMHQIISALMRAIDLHDPHSANHSQKTAQVSLAIAHAMNLDGNSIATVEAAANLCNLGKLSIPRELLLKTEALTEEEQKLLRQESNYAAQILDGIEFTGPVRETIAQKNEFLDGTGYPNALKQDDIILSARILAAANAFVAMTSPRAYRDRLTENDALDQLITSVDTRYDRQVVAALFHVVENKIIRI